MNHHRFTVGFSQTEPGCSVLKPTELFQNYFNSGWLGFTGLCWVCLQAWGIKGWNGIPPLFFFTSKILHHALPLSCFRAALIFSFALSQQIFSVAEQTKAAALSPVLVLAPLKTKKEWGIFLLFPLAFAQRELLSWQITCRASCSLLSTGFLDVISFFPPAFFSFLFSLCTLLNSDCDKGAAHILPVFIALHLIYLGYLYYSFIWLVVVLFVVKPG